MVNENPHVIEKTGCRFLPDTGAKSMNGTSVHLAGSLNQPTKNLTENLLLVGCFISQTRRTSLQLVFQFVVFFFEGLFEQLVFRWGRSFGKFLRYNSRNLLKQSFKSQERWKVGNLENSCGGKCAIQWGFLIVFFKSWDKARVALRSRIGLACYLKMIARRCHFRSWNECCTSKKVMANT